MGGPTLSVATRAAVWRQDVIIVGIPLLATIFALRRTLSPSPESPHPGVRQPDVELALAPIFAYPLAAMGSLGPIGLRPLAASTFGSSLMHQQSPHHSSIQVAAMVSSPRERSHTSLEHPPGGR